MAMNHLYARHAKLLRALHQISPLLTREEFNLASDRLRATYAVLLKGCAK